MYTAYHCKCSAEQAPVLIAFLAAAGFDSFWETDEGVIAYADTERNVHWQRVLDDLNARIPFSYTDERLEERNWNEEWETNFAPIRIDDRLLIRAPFHPADADVEREIVMEPKMAFGTGHHATTHMMCELLLDEPPVGKIVFDYGSGTGVLAILAAQLGAEYVVAVDIEAPAAESTVENAARNGVELGSVIHGTLEDVPQRVPYDLILANINRNVITQTAAALYQRLRPGGKVYFSGILAQDEAMLHRHLVDLGFNHLESRKREDWRALVFSRPEDI